LLSNQQNLIKEKNAKWREEGDNREIGRKEGGSSIENSYILMIRGSHQTS